MNRLIKFLWIPILLVSCNLPGGESTTQPGPATLTSTQVEAEVAEDTLTPPPEVTVTSESVPESQDTPTDPQVPDSPTITPLPFSTPLPLTSGEIITVTKIQMYDPLTGWGVGYQEWSGDHILYTQDGGSTWIDRTPPDTMADQPDEIGSASTHFLDADHAWVIYASRRLPPPLQQKLIWRTSDAGLTWEPGNPLQVDGMEDAFLPRGFASVSRMEGWLLVHIGGGMSHDYSYLYQTLDGGVSWERILDPYGGGIQGLGNTAIAFVDVDYGWVSKDNLGVLPGAFFEQTLDGGRTWERVFLPHPPELDWFNEASLCETSQPTFLGDQTGMLIVKCRLPGDLDQDIDWSLTYIYRTEDRAETWEFSKLPTAVDQLLFSDQDQGWAFGRDLYRTSDGGRSWQPFKMVNWDGQFTFINPDTGWAVARNEAEIALVNTVDAGDTWQIIDTTIR